MWNSFFFVGFMAVSWMGRMGVHGSSSIGREFVVPVMDGDNIQEEELRHILSTSGIVSIRMGDDDDLRQAALSHICDESAGGVGVSTILPDGTKRSTLATATYGMHRPFPLPENNNNNNEALENLRRRVAELSIVFQQALDRIILSSSTTSGKSSSSLSLMTNAKTMQSYKSVTEITSKATHLEHFHHYQAPTTTTTNVQEAAVDVHVDAGLFLAFVPAMDCHHPHQPDRSLKLYLPEEYTAVLEPNTLVFMLGMGAQQWLSTSPLNLQATRHSLQLTSTSRAWYGMMHLVPANAIVQRYPTVQTFADMKQSLVRSTQNPMQAAEQSQEYGIGCASQSVTLPATLTTATTTVQKRHTLEHVGDPSSCDNVNNFYCWMVCQPIPDKLSSVSEQDQELHCMDPSVHHSTQSVEDAVNVCRDPITGAIGGAMEDSCMGVWVATNQENPTSKKERPYCYGATSMLMQGFEWKSNVCLVYLFPQWTISSSNKMILACFATIALGVVLEGILYSRRRAIQSATSKRTKILFSSFFYSLQLTLGYALMLVVMTYSGPLVLSVVIGIVVGHFTIQFLTFNNKAAVTIPEGSTPCCQNDLNACTHAGCVANKNNDQKEEPDCSCQGTVEESSVEANHVDEESPSKYSRDDDEDEDDEEFYKNLPPCCQNKQ